MVLENIARNLPGLLTAAFVAILFLQSSLDKIFDWKGNREWLDGHFSKTFLATFVPLMLGTITILELATGLTAAIGFFYLVFTGSTALIYCAGILGAASITALFFGQRVAKDYPGAAVLVPYFILMLLLAYLAGPQNWLT